ncbi:MAG: rhomboid family intramembrane serine protease [Saprospiraceae bacterium]|nr:rhomboid family intramembrane serine protease [Saprospiraceae bacterium]
MLRLTDVVKNMLFINVIIFIGIQTMPDMWRGYGMLGALFFYQSDFFYPFQIVTSMFMHADLTHLFMNMLGLVMLGPATEMVLGTKRFFTLYIIAGLGASFLSVGIDIFNFYTTGYVTNTFSVGASGCLYGVILAFATMFPNKTLTLFPIPIQVKAKYIGIFSIVYALYAGITDTIPGGIGHFAHLGGALVGFIMIHHWKMANLR